MIALIFILGGLGLMFVGKKFKLRDLRLVGLGFVIGGLLTGGVDLIAYLIE